MTFMRLDKKKLVADMNWISDNFHPFSMPAEALFLRTNRHRKLTQVLQA